MGRKRLKRYREVRSYPIYKEVGPASKKPFRINSIWDPETFGNTHDIVLEVGCGRGEYTLGLASQYPGKNFIGVDIKGDRICLGARKAVQENYQNVFFVNIQIDHLPFFLPQQSISEIWIPFPDPQHGNEDGRMRLTSERFLEVYRYLLYPGASCHLKTDDSLLYEFTLENLNRTHSEIIRSEADLHNGSVSDYDLIQIKTTYEKRYLGEGKKIKYIEFRLI